MTKAELLEAIRLDRAQLDTVVATIDESQMTAPLLDGGWSVKDVIAHVGVWEGYCAGWLEAVARGETPERPEIRDSNKTNARDYAAVKDQPLANVLATARRSHDTFLRAVDALSEADLIDERRFGWPTWQMVSSNSDEHYREHAEQISRLLKTSQSGSTVTPPPKAIFFDMDGTILDWRTGMEESWLASCESHGDGSFAPTELHSAIRTRRLWFWDDPGRAATGRMDLDAASREIVRHAFADLSIDHTELAHRIADDYRTRRGELIAPFPGAIEVLETMRDRGIPMALITNGEARNQRRSVEAHALAQYFRCIVIEGEFGVGKPDARVFQHALSELRVTPADTWMVGDSLEADIAPARELGLHTIWVDELGDGLPATATARPHRIVRTIAELV